MEREIITGVDGSAPSRTAAEWAAGEAVLRGVPVRVVHVTCAEAAADDVVAELLDRHPGLTARGETLTGPPVAALRTAGARGELLVVGVRGRSPVAVGATAAALAATADGPVVLVPCTTDPARRPDRVVVGVDARDPAVDALDFAFRAARRYRTVLHALHAWRLPSNRVCLPWPVPEATRATWEDYEVQLLSDALRPWREKYPDVEVLEDVVLLPAAEGLAHAAGETGLAVVGRRSGTTALALVWHARCPVAVVPS
ncbi:Universal stress protein family protein [Streptomyces sp. DI166]|uniref:universal stress protein n=1 Tax=Streptomyces sp. DI166 TaxID=1839783 RepID=UPI0007F3FF12|nr:universal stress protein [Streptomyces sp. DI166]SBT93393.1 Universal stress protein family protein [Streptomyces sp. DI166]